MDPGADPGPTSSAEESDLNADIIPEQVYHDAALAYLNVQIAASDSLDDKASQALTVGSAALPITIAVVNVARSGGLADGLRLDDLTQAFFAVALVCYLAILALNLWLGRISGIAFQPDMEDLRRNFLAQRNVPLAGRGLKGWVAEAYIDSTEINERLIRRKSRFVSIIQIALAVEGGSLALGAAWALLV